MPGFPKPPSTRSIKPEHSPHSRLFIKKMLLALAISQAFLLAMLVLTVIQLWRTQRVPSPIINVQPVRDRVVSEAYVSVPRMLNLISARVRTGHGSGSAVAISPTLAMTNWHVVSDAGVGNTVWVDTAEGAFVFEVVANDGARDLAILKAPSNFKFGHWAKLHAERMEWGDQVIAVGCANSHLPIPTMGYWIRMAPNGMAQLSISCFWGSSGCGIFDAKSGELAGILVQWDDPMEKNGIKTFPQIFYCIPSQWVRDFIDRYEQSGKAKPAAPKAEVVILPEPEQCPPTPQAPQAPQVPAQPPQK